ncbi:MAG TPA: hypothetical protein PK986_11380 [Spirochaetota bacterium]|nr:hypothetical protein [Spirochaetota bacterium]
MKSIIIPVLTALLWISVPALYAQDNTSGDADVSGGTVVEEVITESVDVTGDNGDVAGSVQDENVESAVSDKTPEVKPREKKAAVTKKVPAEKEKARAETPVNEKTAVAKIEPYSGELLQINEGNFKYRRIPDIKLADTQVTMAADQSADVPAVSEEDQSGSGFMGMSKTASDIVVKGGIIFFIFILFILYKSRMKSPGGRKTSRKVMNSYRK